MGALSCTVTGLTNGQGYTFTVRAHNSAGWSLPSAPSALIKPGVPGPVSNVKVTTGSVPTTVSWDPPTFDGGNPVGEYLVLSSPSGAGCTASYGVLSCVAHGLIWGTTYRFGVISYNGIEEGPEVWSDYVTVYEVPDAPTGLRVAGVSSTGGTASVTFAWTAPTEDGGTPITGYYLDLTSGGTECQTTGAVSCTVNGLSVGTTYSLHVKAANKFGAGAYSNSVSITPTANATATPTAGPSESPSGSAEPAESGSVLPSEAASTSSAASSGLGAAGPTGSGAAGSTGSGGSDTTLLWVALIVVAAVVLALVLTVAVLLPRRRRRRGADAPAAPTSETSPPKERPKK
jgi:hypothetical protein